MRHDPAELQMLAPGKLSRKAVYVGHGNAQPIHARVNFEVEDGWFAGVSDTSSGCPIKRRELLAAMNHRSEIVLQEGRLFAGPKAGEHENRPSDAGFADVDSFICASDPEPV